MPWQLEIHTIDVGAGDSSLIKVSDRTTGLSRSLLIDGGEPGKAPWVHDHLENNLEEPLDVVVVTNYDSDHRGGVQALLASDNLWHACNAIAVIAAPHATAHGAPPREQLVAATAAAATAAALGAWGAHKAWADAVAGAASRTVAPGATDAVAAVVGMKAAVASPVAVHDEKRVLLIPTPSDAPSPTAAERRNAALVSGLAQAVAVAAVNAGAAGRDTVEAACEAAYEALEPSTFDADRRIYTDGLYGSATVHDVVAYTNQGGKIVPGLPYRHGALGFCIVEGKWVKIPRFARTRNSHTALGAEILWAGAAAPAPQGAPLVYLVAAAKQTWPSRKEFLPPAGQRDNAQSLAVVVRFGDFFWYSGGDLPKEGELPVSQGIRGTGLPKPAPATGAFPKPAFVAGFKVGHHGSDSSTSAAFVANLRPRMAVVSCGSEHLHPRPGPIKNVHDSAQLQAFYLTNCIPPIPEVVATLIFRLPHPPWTAHGNQFTAANNKSRIAGDNNRNNDAPHRHRGTILTVVREGETTAGSGRAAVEYWEPHSDPAGTRREWIRF